MRSPEEVTELIKPWKANEVDKPLAPASMAASYRAHDTIRQRLCDRGLAARCMSGAQLALLLALGMLCSACPTIWSGECLSFPTVSGRGNVTFVQSRCERDPDEARRKAAERAAEAAAAERAAAADEQREPATDGEAAAGRAHADSGSLLASPGRRVPAGAGAGRPQSAFMSVRCWRGDSVIKIWSGHTRWTGDVPAFFTGTIEKTRIWWHNEGIDEHSIRRYAA